MLGLRSLKTSSTILNINSKNLLSIHITKPALTSLLNNSLALSRWSNKNSTRLQHSTSPQNSINDPIISNNKKYQDLIKNGVFTKEQIIQSEKDRLNGLGPIISKLPKKIIPYCELMRLEKPVGTWLLYLPCTWSIIISSIMLVSQGANIGLSQTLYMLTLFGLGSLIMRGAGCTINDLLDRNLDDKVIRSLQRPIASGRVTPVQATTFLTAQTALGLGILTQLPHECWWLGLASLPIVFTYPLFKRFTYYPQAALSACFNWGALLGFPAMGLVDWSVMLPLYGATYIWCMIYDTIYAHQDKKFDIKAGIKSTALAWGDSSKKIFYGLGSVQMSLLALTCYNAGILMGPGVLCGLGIFGYRLFNMIKKVDLNNPGNCWKWFKSNIDTGLFFTGALFFDYLLNLFF
ncbi:related to 4-hydroxybenzoate polyprenyltransferase, mitochondrial [Saccharomycodes ludwigii]|uniref:4-hydroxybenzoate polyprenyltransferase, mitochondrial n=1 Tax=Saccharomycodes ludwigii TaxID=36035 RepID=A0A376B8K1_9ASCO|nr:hypothetical protein SCDLUD_003761 [Saccharomycodes ludwigii]KAH3900756.1 hypothetical protein SCDLUD_003761 [Saccharomycodes ludwigii]SSD60941.1 related to 4-hydroxybenzoate polyprenyltransferase, mitochondrial [Saccharomycodes ludwigii]